jgi:hypothetical protein
MTCNSYEKGGVAGISRIEQTRNEGPCSGERFPISDQVGAAFNTRTAAFSTSATRALAYWSGDVYEDRQFVWMDRTGRQLGAAIGSARLKMKFHGDLKLASRVCDVGAAEKGGALYADEVLEIHTIQGIE